MPRRVREVTIHRSCGAAPSHSVSTRPSGATQPSAPSSTRSVLPRDARDAPRVVAGFPVPDVAPRPSVRATAAHAASESLASDEIDAPRATAVGVLVEERTRELGCQTALADTGGSENGHQRALGEERPELGQLAATSHEPRRRMGEVGEADALAHSRLDPRRRGHGMDCRRGSQRLAWTHTEGPRVGKTSASYATRQLPRATFCSCIPQLVNSTQFREPPGPDGHDDQCPDASEDHGGDGCRATARSVPTRTPRARCWRR